MILTSPKRVRSLFGAVMALLTLSFAATCLGQAAEFEYIQLSSYKDRCTSGVTGIGSANVATEGISIQGDDKRFGYEIGNTVFSYTVIKSYPRVGEQTVIDLSYEASGEDYLTEGKALWVMDSLPSGVLTLSITHWPEFITEFGDPDYPNGNRTEIKDGPPEQSIYVRCSL